jgi:D-arabinose 1-dehydrogenase-like Zn-dependent alcohol dehydrogenase
LVSGALKDRVLGYLKQGLAEGARVAAGDPGQVGGGNFVAPVVFADVITSDEPGELRDAVGHQIDVVVDTTPQSVSAVRQALAALATDGRLVLAGIKGHGSGWASDRTRSACGG